MTVFVFWIGYTVVVPCWKLWTVILPSMEASLYMPIDLSRDLCCVCVYILAEPYICNSYSYFVLKSVSLWYSNINVMYFFVIYCFYDVGNIPSLYQTNYEGLFMSQVFSFIKFYFPILFYSKIICKKHLYTYIYIYYKTHHLHWLLELCVLLLTPKTIYSLLK